MTAGRYVSLFGFKVSHKVGDGYRIEIIIYDFIELAPEREGPAFRIQGRQQVPDRLR